MTMILCSFISSRWPLVTSIALKWPWLTLLKMTVNDRSWHEIFKAKMSRYVRYLKYSLNFVKNDIFWIALVLWGNFKNFEYKMSFYRNSGAKDLVSSSTDFYKKRSNHIFKLKISALVLKFFADCFYWLKFIRNPSLFIGNKLLLIILDFYRLVLDCFWGGIKAKNRACYIGWYYHRGSGSV